MTEDKPEPTRGLKNEELFALKKYFNKIIVNATLNEKASKSTPVLGIKPKTQPSEVMDTYELGNS